MKKNGNGRPELSVEDKFRAKREAQAQGLTVVTSHRVVHGDARTMRGLEPGSVQLVVTSPPYWTLKEYARNAGSAQLGHRSDYRLFHQDLNRVWRRCFSALVPGGRMCVVVGDVCLPRRRNGRHLVVPIHADIAINCQRIGFDYLTPIIWYKIANAVTEVEGNGSGFLGKPYEPNGIIKNDCEYILLLRKPGAYRSPTQQQRTLSLIEKTDHAKWFRSIWADVPGASRTSGHPAPFPEELAYRLISMFSFVGDVVLDPFLGTGTTTLAAIRASRSSIGFEIESTYVDLVKRRFVQTTTDTNVSFETERPSQGKTSETTTRGIRRRIPR